MKKLTNVLFAAILGMIMASCSLIESPKDKIMNRCNDYFKDVEHELEDINTGEDFMVFWEIVSEERKGMAEQLFADYLDKDGNIIGIDEKELEDIQNSIYERATAYNNVESTKFSELFVPELDEYEKILNIVYNKMQKGEVPSDGEIEAYYKADERIDIYKEYDNVPRDINERYINMIEKINFVNGIMYE